ncbi:hypothetical protein DU506_01050 [Vreelandella rituensis]|uniref:Uncharacterized protein n=1 Tax=Vreelandella rituensis TaxID=2282306 RepID=A0A368UDE3_9GAMM|nr:hypothetical protein DU506_01050 [Halomonas rituensis]
MAQQPDLNFFKNLEAGTEVRLYLADQRIPSFHWTHERVERDLVYGRIQFEGYSRQFPWQAYLFFDGSQVRLACYCFVTDTGERVDLPSATELYLSALLPSQYRGHGNEFYKPPTSVHFKDRELDQLQFAVSRLTRAGLTPAYSEGRDVRTCYVKFKLKGALDFRLESEALGAAVMIRKSRRGLLTPAKWSLWITDYSNRSVQPGGWGKDGIDISPGSTDIVRLAGLPDMEAVVKALLEGADLLVSRNR